VPSTLVLGLGTLISHGFGLSLTPAMLPRISEDLDVGYGVLGAALATGLVAYSLGALSAGVILDRVPSRGLLVATYVTTAAGLLLAGSAQSVAVVTAAVVVTGFVAPVSWAVTLQVAAATTAPHVRGAVMASASGGAALGVLVNGVLVQTSESLHTWRVSYVVAAAVAVLPIAMAWLVYRVPVARPAPGSGPAGFRAVMRTPVGRLIVLTSSVAGIVGFPFATFLTATALDEMQVTAFSAGALWWLVGLLGVAAGPVIGSYGDRRTPRHGLIALSISYLGGLLVLALLWSYLGLVIAVLGFAVMNYPIWGVLGSAANSDFGAAMAVRAITLGLAGAALAGAVGNAVAGAWIEATGSFRGPVVAIALMVGCLTTWLLVRRPDASSIEVER